MAPPSHPFICKLADGTIVGGSYDSISAVTIACAVYGAAQQYDPSSGGKNRVAVLDDTGVEIALVGQPDAS